LSGFRKFLLRGNVIDLAVAVVIGAAFTAVIQALVKDIITPLIGAFGGVPDFSTLFFSVNNSKFMIGDFINALVSFAIIAAIVYYLIVLPFSAFIERMSSPPTPAATRECPYCLSKIPVKARRCAFCTADVEDRVQTAIDEMTQPET
jgi:large conductance mechanosensitive channel